MHSLHPKAYWIFALTYLVRAVILSIVIVPYSVIILGFSGAPGALALLGLLIIVGIFAWAFIWAKLVVASYRFSLEASAFQKQSGVLYKRAVTIPYQRIQNVDVLQGPLDQVLGLATIQIQTAGSSAVMTRSMLIGVGAEGTLPGLDANEAKKLREDLLSKMSGTQAL